MERERVQKVKPSPKEKKEAAAAKSSENQEDSSSKSDSKKEEHKVLVDIAILEEKIKEFGEKMKSEHPERTRKATLGEYLWSLRKESKDEQIRKKHTRRSMYEEEFDLIWQKQAEFHPKILTEELRQKFRLTADERKTFTLEQRKGKDLLFFVRSIYWRQSTIGKCEFVPDKFRCLRAERPAQEFRLLQEINNLKYTDNDDKEQRISAHSRYQEVVEKAKEKSEIEFDEIRQILGDVSSQFNFEMGNKPRTKIGGYKTDAVMRKKEYFGKGGDKKNSDKGWDAIPEDVKDKIVRVLLMKPLEPDNPEYDDWKFPEGKEGREGVAVQMSREALHTYIAEHWAKYVILDTKDKEDTLEKHIEALIDVADDLPKGCLSVSRNAILKMLPFLRKGKLYSGEKTKDGSKPDDALHGAGYELFSEKKSWDTFDCLPRLLHKFDGKKRKNNLKTGLCVDFPMINNSVVRRIVSEVRHLVNIISKKYGRPDKIRVELAREAKNSKKKRKDISDVQTANEKEREYARAKIREAGYYPSEENIKKLRLWQQQGGVCPYTSIDNKRDADRRKAIEKKKYDKEEKRNEEKRKDALEKLEKDIAERKKERAAGSAYASATIGFNSLFSDSIEIDHIVPRSYYTDNNIMNLVVCYREANQEKGNRTPYQWLGDGEEFEALKARVAHFPVKKPALTKKDDPKVNDFTRRQLQDTQYASRYLVSYLRCIFKPEEFRNDEDKFDPPVLTVKGGATATLRNHWALNKFLHKSEFKSERLLLIELCENIVANWKTTRYKTLTEYVETLDDYKKPKKGEEDEDNVKQPVHIQKLLDFDSGFDGLKRSGSREDYIDKRLQYWRQNTKNRGDHRHHFIDSVVIALTDQEMLARINEWEKKRADGIKENFSLPWKTFRDDVEKAVDEIGNGKTKSVSHRPKGRVRGQLHKDTNYGQNVPNNANTPESGEFVTRKELAKLTPSMVFKIKDKRVRDIVLKRLKDFGLEPDQKGKSLNIEETGKKAKVGEIKEALGEMLQELPREFVSKLSNPDWSKVPEELKELMLSTLAEKGIAYSETLVNKKNDASPNKVLKAALANKLYHCPKWLNFDKFNPDGIDIPEKDKPKYEINKVRIVVKNDAIVRLREEKRLDGTPNPDAHIFVETGSTHHICLFEDKTVETKKGHPLIIPVFVTRLEANKILLHQGQLLEKKRKELKLTAKEAKQNAEFKAYRSCVLREFPLIQKDAAKISAEKFLDGQAHPNAKFLFSLKPDETFIVRDKDVNGNEVEKLVVFKTAPSTSGQFSFIDVRDARKDAKPISKSSGTLADIIEKVCVDRLGVVHKVGNE